MCCPGDQLSGSRCWQSWLDRQDLSHACPSAAGGLLAIFGLPWLTSAFTSTCFFKCTSLCVHVPPPLPPALKKLFFWLCWVLVAACGIFVAACGIISSGWALVPWPGMETNTPPPCTFRAQNLSNWTTKEVPSFPLFTRTLVILIKIYLKDLILTWLHLERLHFQMRYWGLGCQHLLRGYSEPQTRPHSWYGEQVGIDITLPCQPCPLFTPEGLVQGKARRRQRVTII